jgi:hypothetical protein
MNASDFFIQNNVYDHELLTSQEEGLPMNETNEEKCMIIRVPLQYKGESKVKQIEVTGNNDTTVTPRVTAPPDTKLLGIEPATLYWYKNKECVGFMMGGMWVEV